MAEDKNASEDRAKSEPLGKSAATEYRALAARLNYLALDRPDLQFPAKVISKYMATPCEHDWVALKRVARYLVGATRVVQKFEWQCTPSEICCTVSPRPPGDSPRALPEPPPLALSAMPQRFPRRPLRLL